MSGANSGAKFRHKPGSITHKLRTVDKKIKPFGDKMGNTNTYTYTLCIYKYTSSAAFLKTNVEHVKKLQKFQTCPHSARLFSETPRAVDASNCLSN
jgi:hypothetical protein